MLGIFLSNAGELGYDSRHSVAAPKKIDYFASKNIKIKDINCGIRHSVALAEDGTLYTWGRGEFGLLGNGSNSDKVEPTPIELFQMLLNESKENEIVRLDCGDEYNAVVTKGGDIYVWGKNTTGQLGIGSGIGIDYTESEKFPILMRKNTPDLLYKDISCGENGMFLLDSNNNLYRTGWRLYYNPSPLKYANDNLKEKRLFMCGNSYFCVIDSIISY
jgi:alpha-tubulin suppressor-like RCC1 family protein